MNIFTSSSSKNLPVCKSLTLFSLILLLLTPGISFAQAPSTDINTYVLFAYHQLNFKGRDCQCPENGVISGGNVGVNSCLLPSNQRNLVFGGPVTMDDNTHVVGYKVAIDDGSDLWEVFANDVSSGWDVGVLRNPHAPNGYVNYNCPLIAVLPGCPNFTAGVTDITVAENGSQVLAPGNYANIVLKDNSTLTLQNGTYNLVSINAGKGVKIITTDGVIVNIEETMLFNDNGNVGPSNFAQFNVCGSVNNGNVVRFSHNQIFHGQVLAPNGTFNLGHDSDLFGRFWALDISSDFNVSLHYDAPCTVTDPNLASSTTPTSSTVCNAPGCDGAVSLTVSGNNSPVASYSWSNGATTKDISGVCPGPYNVTITLENGCGTNTGALVVCREDAPCAPITTGDSRCDTGVVHLSAEGCPSCVTLTWYKVCFQTGDQVVNVGPTYSPHLKKTKTFYVTCKDADGNESARIPVTGTILEPEFALSHSETPSSNCQEPNCNGTITLSVENNVSPVASYSWSNGSTTKDISGLCPGKYYVTVTLEDGCSKTDSGSISCQVDGCPTPNTLITDINSYVLFAYDELIFKGGSENAGWGNIFGNIGVNYPDNSPTGYALAFATSAHAKMSDGSQAVAHSVRADAAGSFYDLYANVLNPSFAATIRHNGPLPFNAPIIATADLPVLPFTPCRALTDNAADLTIPKDGVFIFPAAPQAYKDVRFNDNTTITFGPGVYDMRNLSMGKHVTIIVDEATVLQIDKMFDPNDFLHFGIGTNSGAHIYVGGCGINVNTTRATNFSHNAEIHASYFSPTAWLDLGGQNNLYGHYWAQRITGDPNNNVYGPDCECTLEVIAIKTNTKCNGSCDGTATVTPSKGVSPYNIVWDKQGITGFTPSNLCAGPYCYTVSDASGCFETGCVTITQPLAITDVISGTNPTDCIEGQCNGSATVTPSGGTVPYTISWSNGKTGSPITGLCAGKYKATITDANGCSIVDSVTLLTTNCDCPIVLNSHEDVTTCYGACTGSITVYTLAPINNKTIVWDNASVTGFTPTGLCAGTYCYTVTLTDFNCTRPGCVTIGQPDSIDVDVTHTDVTCTPRIECEGFRTQSKGGWGTNCNGQNPGCYRDNHFAGCFPNGLTIGCAGGTTFTLNTSEEVKNFEFGGNSLAKQLVAAILSVKFDLCDPDFSSNNDVNLKDLIYLGPGVYNGKTIQFIIDEANNVYGGCAIASGDLNTVLDIFNNNYDDGTQDNGNFGCTPDGGVTTGECNGTIDVTAAGGTGDKTIVWSNVLITGFHPTGLCAGHYCFTVTDANGCSKKGHVKIKQSSAIVSGIAGTNPTNCTAGQCNGSASVSPSGGTLPYTITWSNGKTGSPITGLCAGKYKVTIVDANKCSTIDSVTLLTTNCDCPIVLNSHTDAGPCYGACNGSITVYTPAAINNKTIVWDKANVTGFTPTGLCAGTYCYTVTLTDFNCTRTGCVTVTQPDSLHVAVEHTNLTCNQLNGLCDASIKLTITGGTPAYTIKWSNNLFGFDGTEIDNLCPDTYCYTVTDANGCSKVGCVTITEPPMLLIASNCCPDEIACHNECSGKIKVTIYGGVPEFTYSWSGPNGYTSTDANIFHLCPGFYTLTVTDANGCTYDHLHHIINPDSIEANITGTPNTNCIPGQCNGTATIAPSGGTAPYSVLWSTGGTDNTITGLCAGKYKVTIEDALGCLLIDSIRIFAPSCECPAVTSSHTDIKCYNSCTGSVSVHITKPIPAGVTITWTGPGGTFSTADTTTSGLCAGTYCYTVTFTNLNCNLHGCETIAQPTELIVTKSATDASCNGKCDGTATVTVSGGTPVYTITWDKQGVYGYTPTGLCAGTYCFTVTDANGCPKSGCVEVKSNTLTVKEDKTNLTCTSTCGGSCDGSVKLTVTSTAAYTINWAGSTSHSATRTGLCAGTYCYTVTSGTCNVTGCITLTKPKDLVICISGTNATCAATCGGSATVSATSGDAPFTYKWSNGKTGVTSITSLCPATYCVTVTSATGCTASKCICISGGTPISISICSTDINCNSSCNGTASVSASGGSGYKYLWNNGKTTSSINCLCANTYCVTVTSANGCSAYKCVTIKQTPGITISTSSTNISCNSSCNGTAGVSVTSGTGPFTYKWSNGKTSSSLTCLCAGCYCVTVTNCSGCSATACVTVTEPKPICVNVSITNPTCNGGCNGVATASATGGNGTFTYKWSNTKTTASITGLCPGSYTVTVTSGACCVTKCITICQPSSSVKICLTGKDATNGCNGSACVSTVSGGIAPYKYKWSNALTTTCIYNLKPGTYSVTVCDVNGCSATGCVTVKTACYSRLDDESGEGISEGTAVTVYPNPFSDNAVIEINTITDTHATLEVYNLTGQKVAVVFDGELKGSTLYSYNLNGTELPAGMYIVRLNTATESKTINVVRTKN